MRYIRASDRDIYTLLFGGSADKEQRVVTCLTAFVSYARAASSAVSKTPRSYATFACCDVVFDVPKRRA